MSDFQGKTLSLFHKLSGIKIKKLKKNVHSFQHIFGCSPLWKENKRKFDHRSRYAFRAT